MKTETKRRPARRWLRRVGLIVFLSCGLYGATLFLPRMFFRWAREETSILVRSDVPIPDSATPVIRLAEAKVRLSPLFDRNRAYEVYVCDSRWRWNYFSGFNGRSRAFATPIGRAVYTRRARWDENRLVGPDGDNSVRPLDAYIAHEVTHVMMTDQLGWIAAARLPAWVREGYAEYVARHESFDYDATRARLLAGDADIVDRRRDPYLIYLLLVAHLLEREGWEVHTLLGTPPKREEVEAQIRKGAASHSRPN